AAAKRLLVQGKLSRLGHRGVLDQGDRGPEGTGGRDTAGTVAGARGVPWTRRYPGSSTTCRAIPRVRAISTNPRDTPASVTIASKSLRSANQEEVTRPNFRESASRIRVWELATAAFFNSASAASMQVTPRESLTPPAEKNALV